MAKRNVKADKEVVEQPKTDVQPVQETAGNPDTTQATPEQGGGEQTDDKRNTGVDSETQETTTVTEGGGTGDQTINDNDQELYDETEETYQEAKRVIEKMVDDRLQEKGVIAVESFEKGKAEKCKKIASDVFEKHSNTKVLYFTDDLIPFFDKSDAFRHAGTLKNDTVVTINKE